MIAEAAAYRLRRILVGWNSRREAVRAVADSLRLLVRADAVEVLVVDHERHPAGHGQEPGADIARHLARHGAQVEVRRLSSAAKTWAAFCCHRRPPSAPISSSWAHMAAPT